MGGVATLVVISGQSKLFRDNQSYSGTIWAKADFRDPSGTLPGQLATMGLLNIIICNDLYLYCKMCTYYTTPLLKGYVIHL